MEDNQRFVIGNKIITRKELFAEKEKLRKAQASLSFKEKIKTLIAMQRIARDWGRRDVIIWMGKR